MHNVLVYGSLRRGLHNHYLLEHTLFVGNIKTPALWTLYDLGAFPAVVPGGNTAITGEVYQVDDATFAELDLLEGYPDFYQRRQIDTDLGLLWIYYLPKAAPDFIKVDSGDWLTYLRKRSRTEADQVWQPDDDDDEQAFIDGLDLGDNNPWR